MHMNKLLPNCLEEGGNTGEEIHLASSQWSLKESNLSAIQQTLGRLQREAECDILSKL